MSIVHSCESQFRNSSGRYTNNTRISAYTYLWIGIHQSYCIPGVPSCICITGYALFLEYAITSYLLVLLRASPTGADLPRFHYNHRFRDGRSSKTKSTLGDKGFFWNGSIMIYSKISVSCFVCSDKESCRFFNIVQKDSLSLILRVELFRF